MSNERIHTLTEWIQSDPNDPFLHYALALELKKTGESAKATHLLQKLVDTFPDYLPAYYQLGINLEETGNKNEALAIYQTGHRKAKEQKDMKTAGEIAEAIQRLEFE